MTVPTQVLGVSLQVPLAIEVLGVLLAQRYTCNIPAAWALMWALALASKASATRELQHATWTCFDERSGWETPFCETERTKQLQMVRTNEESQHKLEQFAKFNAISFQCITDMVKVHVNYPSCDLLEFSFLAMASDKIGNELNADIYSLPKVLQPVCQNVSELG